MEDSKNILLTAFCGTSAEWLIKDAERYKTLFLPNDKIRDSEKLINTIINEKFAYVLSFGQRPNIRDKVHIETTARDAESAIVTDFDCRKLKDIFEQNGIVSKISHNAGTSFCNQLYFNGLRYISQNSLELKMVFVHIPFMKNMVDFDGFRQRIFRVIEEIAKEKQ